MTPTMIFTGSAGPGVAVAAATTAARAAADGRATLLLSLGPPHSLAALLGAEVGTEPRPVAPRLDALAIDPPAEVAAEWERGRKQFPAQLAQVGGDELPLLPGIEGFFALRRLHELAPRYDLVAIDAGPHDAFLRALALPDALRWSVRLMFGLDRGPGRSPASVGRALLPTSFIPVDTINRVQDLRVEAERLRATLTDPSIASVYYVLRPDRQALEEARLAVAALQLHGLAVTAILAGPLLPDGLAGTPLAPHAEGQAALLDEAGALWPTRPLLRFGLPAGPGVAALLQAGESLGVQHRDLAALPAPAPIAHTYEGVPAVVVELPGAPRQALQLTLSGDELIVRLGPYRRHLLLPEGLRGISAIKATREGERLVVRKR